MSLRLAELGHAVVASVEIIAQVNTLRAEGRDRGVELRVEKPVVTDEGDRAKALDWGVDVPLNNAGISDGVRPSTCRPRSSAVSSRSMSSGRSS
ncbi:hypothetical protein [Corynebacterium variabile]